MMPAHYLHSVDTLIDLALAEDVAGGDITTDHLVAPGTTAEGFIIAKEPVVVAGMEVARRVFERLDPHIEFSPLAADGDSLETGSQLVTMRGQLSALLIGERTALNFLQRLSGIATQARRHVEALKDSPVRLVDTRKTTPGWRLLEKYAVRTGGAANHRMGLYDGVLIKDNHIAACGGITAAVAKIRQCVSHLVKVEVEAATIEQVDEALAAQADVIMLDNMDLPQIRAAVARIAGRALVEISGGVTIRELPALAATGVDLISMGALTHSARAVDLSMRIH